MPITLPTLPWQITPKPELLDFGADMKPPLGGSAQRYARLGSRHSVAITLPPLTQHDAAPWLAALKKARATGSTVLMAWPKPLVPSGLGSPVVNGGSQIGTGLVCKSFTAAAAIPADTYFSFVVSGRTYLYSTTDAAAADGSGNATIAIEPLLRASPADAAALNFAAPNIEGFLQGSSQVWSTDEILLVTISFVIEEAK